MEFWNKPCAAPGLISYRYRGRFGWIMIGAHSHQEALREAARSTQGVDNSNLQVWDGRQYADAYPVNQNLDAGR